MMKKLGDLLARNRDFRKSSGETDVKIVEKAFIDTLRKELPNIARADIQSFKLRDKKIYLKTAHPAIASEIWRRRERLKNEINNFLESENIEEIKVK